MNLESYTLKLHLGLEMDLDSLPVMLKKKKKTTKIQH